MTSGLTPSLPTSPSGRASDSAVAPGFAGIRGRPEPSISTKTPVRTRFPGKKSARPDGVPGRMPLFRKRCPDAGFRLCPMAVG